MNLKEYRSSELKAFAVANVIVVLYFSNIISFEAISNTDQYMSLLVMLLNSTFFSAVFSVLVIVLDTMISSRVKRYLIFWWRTIPGETVFTDILKKPKLDNRFTQTEAHTIYKKIYNDLESIKDARDRNNYENTNWYRLFIQHEEEKSIAIAHRDYLMCRDMAVSALITIVIYVIGTTVAIIPFSSKCVIYLIVMYIIANIATTTKSKRLVQNVIAIDIAKKLKKDTIN